MKKIYAIKEKRYGKKGVNFWFNPALHGFHVHSGWMDLDDFNKVYDKRPEYDIEWKEEPDSAYFYLPYDIIKKKYKYERW